ncbi:protein YLS3 [Tripterygium wilfordii]|uniref:Protein YLS3 n=1 Tax=Tripterygium wilfordii TaxID=458696 RepID=A0A7J7CNZ1_TRIWF|nr:non-specific lipid transfer protein GPI-anchored 6-like [Tripterygium wilfordii]KAF5735718.1 protein YLS3 [Tripterygium wilfordii]
MKMGSSNIGLWLVVVLMLVGLARSDVEQDRAECADKLVGLAPCLSYVGGQTEAPTPDCCSGLKQVLDKSRKCLCVLIKDRDDPKLGLKVNATLAATLPNTCHASANITECIDLLHLAPNSTDAKMFKEFANITAGKNTTITTTGDSTAGNGGGRRESLALKMFCGCGALILASHLIIFHI